MQRLLLAILVLAMVLGACGGDDTSTQIEGVWKTADGFYLTIEEDGTYVLQDKPPGHEREFFFESGNYDLDGANITYHSTNQLVPCDEIPGDYEVAFSEDGNAMTSTLIDDECIYERTTTPRSLDLAGEFSRYTP